jgi:hypothetical protein
MAVSLVSTGITFPDGSTQTTRASQSPAFTNRIINGAMVIDQRNAGAAIASPSDNYTTDRFYSRQVGGGVASAQQSSTAPAGFKKSLLFTVTTVDSSLSAGDRYYLTQFIEGYNIADLGWGTASASTVTLSFWVRSSLTGTFGGALNNGGTRSYPFTYTINAANTFEQKTITIAGDTSGTWGSTNDMGLQVFFTLGAGSSYIGTAGSWSSNNYLTATGATDVIATNGATFYITGVQLEKGSTATAFDYRPYGTELALCQRYYQKSGSGSGVFTTTTVISMIFPLGVTMRATPTVLGVGAYSISDNVVADYVQSSANAALIAANENGVLVSLGNFTGGSSSKPVTSRFANTNLVTFSSEL